MRRSRMSSRFSPFLLVGRNGEIVRAQVDAGGRLVEIDDDELVMHAVAAAARRLAWRRLGNVLVERRREDGSDVAVRHLQVEAADLLVGNAVDEDILAVGDLLDRFRSRRALSRERPASRTGRRSCVPDVVGDRLQQAVRLRVRRERDRASMSFRPRSVQLRGSLSPNSPGSSTSIRRTPQKRQRRPLAPQHHRVVGLHEEPAPAEIGRAAHHRLHLRAVDHDGLVVLKLPMCWRLTLSARPKPTRRFAAWVSPDLASPWRRRRR